LKFLKILDGDYGYDIIPYQYITITFIGWKCFKRAMDI